MSLTRPAATDAEARSPVLRAAPLLLTRVVPALWHVTLLPARLTEERQAEVAQLQATRHHLPTCLVQASGRGFYLRNGGTPQEGPPPAGGVLIAGRLLPPEPLGVTAELQERLRCLEPALGARAGALWVLGDRKKGGRCATPEERAQLEGHLPCGAPRGLTPCMVCGELRGCCLDPNPRLQGLLVQVACRCDNRNRCAACGGLLYRRKLNGNFFDAATGQVWHVPGICGLSHRCEAVEHRATAPGPQDLPDGSANGPSPIARPPAPPPGAPCCPPSPTTTT
jgi:hypothetical protein